MPTGLFFQQSVNFLEQPRKLYRLSVIVVAARFKGFLTVPGHRMGRDRNDGNGPGLRRRFDSPGRFPTLDAAKSLEASRISSLTDSFLL